MERKLKFRPKVTRIKLNPEQAVLTCDCWNEGLRVAGSTGFAISGHWYIHSATGAYCGISNPRGLDYKYATPARAGHTCYGSTSASSS